MIPTTMRVSRITYTGGLLTIVLDNDFATELTFAGDLHVDIEPPRSGEAIRWQLDLHARPSEAIGGHGPWGRLVIHRPDDNQPDFGKPSTPDTG